MTMKISRAVVDKAIAEGSTVDRSARIAELERQLVKVRKDIAEQERLENRWKLHETACRKLRRELGKTLTPEERQSVDGLYIFLHGGCVDFVRHIPSATSRGEDKQLEKDLDMADALHELEDLIK